MSCRCAMSRSWARSTAPSGHSLTRANQLNQLNSIRPSQPTQPTQLQPIQPTQPTQLNQRSPTQLTLLNRFNQPNQLNLTIDTLRFCTALQQCNDLPSYFSALSMPEAAAAACDPRTYLRGVRERVKDSFPPPASSKPTQPSQPSQPSHSSSSSSSSSSAASSSSATS